LTGLARGQEKCKNFSPQFEYDLKSSANCFFVNRVTRDRCYDFKNIFAKKISEKIGVFDSKQSQILKKNDHNIGF
jgi:hypothetical protein